MFTLLTVCTGNSTRSIIAEAILRREAEGRFAVASAGSNPVGRVHPATYRLLDRKGLPSRGFRSKSWREFAPPEGDRPDLILFLCPAAEAELSVAWPRGPMSTLWEIEEPAAAQNDLAFDLAYIRLARRIEALLSDPIEDMTRDNRRWRLDRIAETGGEL
ncbi:MAG: arsenate reductase ArsC [Pseudomonadota bacterium]